MKKKIWVISYFPSWNFQESSGIIRNLQESSGILSNLKMAISFPSMDAISLILILVTSLKLQIVVDLEYML